MKKCIICGEKANRIRKINGVFIGFCKEHSFKDYNISVIDVK